MVNGRCQHCIGTPGGGAPLHVSVVLNKTVSDQVLKLLLHIGLTKKLTGGREGGRRERERKGREGTMSKDNAMTDTIQL